MKLEGKNVVVTGGAGGIGAALARRFHAEGAAGITLADIQAAPLDAVAEAVGGLAVVCDVTDEAAIQDLVGRAEDAHGPIDVFCSNAGVALTGDESAPDADWRLSWELHVMAHVYAARSVAPGMAAPWPLLTYFYWNEIILDSYCGTSRLCLYHRGSDKPHPTL